jgi:hypothetical protein
MDPLGTRRPTSAWPDGGEGRRGVASMVLRFRRLAGVERQEVKWVVAGVLLVAVMLVFSAALSLAGVADYSGRPSRSPWCSSRR